jgi:hypothetical protein
MARYNERSTRQSRFSEEEEPRGASRRPNSSGRGSGRGRQQKEQPKQIYVPIFALFGTEHANGRLQVDVRTFAGKDTNIEDVLSLDEFLFFCEKLYYGEAKLTGSMWECDEKFASMSGNVRMSEEQLEELKDDYEASKSKRKVEPKQSQNSRKPKYDLPEEDDEEEEVEAPPKRTKTPVKPVVELDMISEEVGAEEEPPFQIPY